MTAPAFTPEMEAKFEYALRRIEALEAQARTDKEQERLEELAVNIGTPRNVLLAGFLAELTNRVCVLEMRLERYRVEAEKARGEK